MRDIYLKLFLFFKSLSGTKVLLFFIIDIVFWILIFCILLINFYAAGSIFLYEDNHDHHLAFFSYLGGMAANGILPGIDFYSPHSVLIPIVIGLFFKIFGISQINLGIADGILIFITMLFVYKTARFVMPSIFAKLSIVVLLLNHSGRDNPWFNDVIMLFVAVGVYLLCSYVHKKSNLKLVLVGIILFMLPLMRQQGIVISFVFLIMPSLLFYTKQISKCEYKHIFLTIFTSFILSSLVFLIFVLIRNGVDGLEILFSSFGPLVDMAQPAIGYDNDIQYIANSIFNYTADGIDWHGYFMRYLSYWFIVIIPCLYFIYRPFYIYSGKNFVSSYSHTITFITAIITISTIVFNYPVNEDARMRVQFGIGIWLFIEALRLCFYHKNTKIVSIVFICILLSSINYLKVVQFIDRFKTNYSGIISVQDGYQKMPSGSPYENMKFKDEYATHLNGLLSSIENYHHKYPDRKIIFNGELVSVNNYLFLLFSGPKIAIAHKFPYYYSSFDRKDFFKDIDKEFNQFIEENKPIILDCEFTKDNLPNGYTILDKPNKICNILVPNDERDF